MLILNIMLILKSDFSRKGNEGHFYRTYRIIMIYKSVRQLLKPRSSAKTMAWARVHTPSLSKVFET